LINTDFSKQVYSSENRLI